MPSDTASEPSMDEILASIRRIVTSEPERDDPAVEGAPSTMLDPRQDEVAEAMSEAVEPLPSPVTEAAYAAEETRGPDEKTHAAASAAFDDLAHVADQAAKARATLMPPAGRTLEDLTRELLAPMLKAWLEENLPPIVRARVDEEVTRIARGRVR